MTYQTTITRKGQATIPKSLRDRYRLSPPAKVIWEERTEGILARPSVDFLEVARRIRLDVKRRFKGKKIPDVLKARAYMEKQYRRV